MLIVAHVLIALSSIVYATFLACAPSAFRLRVSATLVAATIASGTYVAVASHAQLLQACLSGLAYLAVTLSAMAVAQYRLRRASN